MMDFDFLSISSSLRAGPSEPGAAGSDFPVVDIIIIIIIVLILPPGHHQTTVYISHSINVAPVSHAHLSMVAIQCLYLLFIVIINSKDIKRVPSDFIGLVRMINRTIKCGLYE